MSKTEILNFSLGPVQGFIARARKTRDFWAGSFLLSYLAGQAMAVVLEKGGRLILPAVAESKNNIIDLLLQAIVDCRDEKEMSRNNRGNIVATLPNRFRAEVSADFDPALCEQAIKEKWRDLTQIIWERYLAGPAARGNSTAEIWKRQVSNYWETNWVLGEDPAVLEQRKNWRSHLPSIEPGDKCTLFGNLQELSGYLRIHEIEKQKDFWEAVRQQIGRHDLAENERLCAIALVKRLFPVIASEMIDQVVTSYPSTPYLAAVNWIGQVARRDPEKARLYANRASDLPEARGRENPELFPDLQRVLAKYPHAREFASLDGNCFFKAALENSNLWDKPAGSAPDTKNLRDELSKELAELAEPPSPFYAMLLMDGDRLGALLQKHRTEAELISGSLNKFSLKVPSVIKSENGITVYAGGDDVLALLPLDNAIAAATALHTAYLKAFNDKFPEATISGAIVYAHFSTPLTEVYHEAQRLLTDVAKEKTGRDSLAITIWKSAGKVLTWSAPWEFILGPEQELNIFEDFIQSFQKETTDEEKIDEFSNSFFYNIQNRLALFADEEADLPLSSDNDLSALLAAEYIKSRSHKPGREKAVRKMRQLLKLCRRSWRDQDGKLCQDQKRLQLESAFLIKFLVEKGVE
jgi:CRISPR-associated protein Cmr2